MRTTVIAPLVFGLAGAGVLIGLGKWQLDRLAWKEGILAQIEARIAAPPVALPEDPDMSGDLYLPVRMTGTLERRALRVLVSRKQLGAGYRLISAFDTGARRVLLDRGYIKVAAPVPAPPAGDIRITGNLHWPDDRQPSTPENDTAGNTWFARDIGAMAGILDTEPVLVVARSLAPAEDGVTPLPVDAGRIPNDHLEYAITWFSLAAVWLGMTAVFIRRMRRTEKGTER